MSRSFPFLSVDTCPLSALLCWGTENTQKQSARSGLWVESTPRHLENKACGSVYSAKRCVCAICPCTMFYNMRLNLCSPSLQYIHSAGIIHRVGIWTFFTAAIVSHSLSVCVYWSCSPEGMVLGNVLICFLAKCQNLALNSFSNECL